MAFIQLWRNILTLVITSRRCNIAVGFCRECDTQINLGEKPVVGQRVTCSDCGCYLEVVDVDPIRLDWVFNDYDSDDKDD